MSPRPLRPRLRQLLERANPHTCTVVEFSALDQAAVLRRDDQFLSAPTLVSMTPTGSAVASPAGALTLASGSDTTITQLTPNGAVGIPQEQGSDVLHRVAGWKMAPGFGGAVLRGVTVRLQFNVLSFTDVALQIYRVHRQAGYYTRVDGTSTVVTEGVAYTFVPLLAEPVVRHYADILASGVLSGNEGNVPFLVDRVELLPLGTGAAGPDDTGEEPEYFFEISTRQSGAGDFVHWMHDTTSPHTFAGYGDMREVLWQRQTSGDATTPWVRSDPGTALAIQLDLEAYSATSTDVYALTLPAAPASGTTGRVVFERGLPHDTAATLELSTAGASGPWTPVANGDLVPTPQTTYHARLTMTASADAHRAPVVTALGVEFRRTVDLSPESTVEPMAQDVAVPFLAPSIGEGKVTSVRAGRRDYRDGPGDLATAGADTTLEASLYLASRHPLVTRDDWFLMARADVSGRQPTPVTEVFSLLSIAKRLKRKIPARVESINSVHVVASATTSQITINTGLGSGALPGTTPTGNEYDAQGYYLRIRATTQTGLAIGQVFTIDGNTDQNKLDFSTALPGTLAAGDVVEVHSARYQQPSLAWVDADPADVWEELLLVHLGIPSDRVGLADVGSTGRAGRPPKVTDIAPGDTATQAKRRVTLRITAAETGDTLIDQVSFLMGGVTVEIAGQLVFRQIYPLRDGAGLITVPPEPVAAVFDPRDTYGLDTPTGREQRITVLACDYGVDSTSGAAEPASTAVYVDADALAELGTQDVEGLGTATVPADIARWCYNSADQGAFLAQQLAGQVVRAASTGLRVWPWSVAEARPGLTVGDTVVVITDQYTDWDPARRVPVRGWAAYTLTLLATSEGGRRFKGYLQGLANAAPFSLRGGPGTLQDVAAPTLSVTPTPDPVAWSLGWVGRPTVELSIDGGVFGPPGTSPIIVSLDAAAHTYRFRASGVGVPVEQTISIPAFAAAGAGFSSIALGIPDYTAHDVPVTWTPSGAPVGATYTVTVQEQTGVSSYDTYVFPNVTSPYLYTPFATMLASGTHTKNLRASVQMLDASGATVLAQSAIDERTFNVL